MRNDNFEKGEDIIAGRNPVSEALKSGRSIERILVAHGEMSGSVKVIVAKAKEKGIPIKEVDSRKLDFMCGNANHQGIIAIAAVKEYVSVDEILKIAEEKGEKPFIIILDNIEDPHNLGFATFYLLQVRPIVDNKEVMEEDLTLVEQEDTILTSTSVLGHGIVTDVQDIIYVKTGAFCSSNNQSIAYDIEKMNRQFTGEEKNYVLVGPGRWGSSDSWLGIPVKWPHISNARVIVECGLENYRVDPSQGTHFYQRAF